MQHSQGLVLLTPAGSSSPGKAGQAALCWSLAGDSFTIKGYQGQAPQKLESVILHVLQTCLYFLNI